MACSLQAEFSPTRASRCSYIQERKVAGYLVGHGAGMSRTCVRSPFAGPASDLSEAFDCSGNWGPSLFAGFHNKNRSFNISEPRINERIRVPEVRLVGPAGEQVGIVRIEDALRLAAESDLDLVEVAPQAKPPVCKLMDFGKYLYQLSKKAQDARRHQTKIHVKEVKFRPKTDEHDYTFKKNHVLRFLKQGDKGKTTIMCRGRENVHVDYGMRILRRLLEEVRDAAIVEVEPKQEGNNLSMILTPRVKT